MRVVHTISGLASKSGGPSRSVPALVAAVRGCHVQAELYFVDGRGIVPQQAGAIGVRALRPSVPRGLCASREMLKTLRASPPDICHAHCIWDLPAHYAALVACWSPGR